MDVVQAYSYVINIMPRARPSRNQDHAKLTAYLSNLYSDMRCLLSWNTNLYDVIV